jgi:hypothetical protein
MLDTQSILDLAKANQDVYLTAYREGQTAGLKTANRLAGAIEDYLDGESQGNVTGLRQALAAFASAKGVERGS